MTSDVGVHDREMSDGLAQEENDLHPLQ